MAISHFGNKLPHWTWDRILPVDFQTNYLRSKRPITSLKKKKKNGLKKAQLSSEHKLTIKMWAYNKNYTKLCVKAIAETE